MLKTFQQHKYTKNYSPMFKTDPHFKRIFNTEAKLFGSAQKTLKYIQNPVCDIKFRVYKF